MNDIQSVYAISGAGLRIERMRVEITALNLANANALQNQGQSVYQARRVIATAGAFDALASNGEGITLPTAIVLSDPTTPRAVSDPRHPLADANGFVYYPNVDTAVEMVELMGAVRAYEANLAVINASRAMALKAMDIGGQS